MIYTTNEKFINTNVKIAIIGVGGTGAYLVSLMAQLNYILQKISEGHSTISVTAYDNDDVSVYNVGRQNFFPQDIGKNKAKTIIRRINMGFGTNWKFIESQFKPSESSKFDVIMTCVDNVKTRIEIGQSADGKDSNCIWIDGGNDATGGNILFGHLGKPKREQKLPNWYDLYYETMKTVKDREEESCSHSDSINKQGFGVNQQTALLMSQFVWKMLRHGEVEIGAQYFDLKEGEMSALEIDPSVWESFGYIAHKHLN